MKQFLLKIIRNKYALATSLFMTYSLFLDDSDIFSIVTINRKLNKIEQEKSSISNKLKETQYTIDRLKYTGEIERFARERKYFKKDDEDVFVIFQE